MTFQLSTSDMDCLLLMHLTRCFVLIIFSSLELRLGTDAAKDHQVQEMEPFHREVDVAVKFIQMWILYFILFSNLYSPYP